GGGLSLLANADGARAALDAIARVQRQIVAAGAARVHADEAARHRLARELHDSVGAELAATRFAIANVYTWRPADAPPHGADALALVARSLDDAANAVRHVLDGLHAPELDAGLATALKRWTRGFASRTGLSARFAGGNCDARLAALPAEAALAVFRVAQEALTNVARHAQAAHVEVRLDSTERELILTVTDDGVGLSREAARRVKRQSRQQDTPHAQHARDDAHGAASRSYYGVSGMRERCAAFGGTLRAATAQPGQPRPGTTVEARFVWDTLCTGASADPAAAPTSLPNSAWDARS
ncbi:ATP-binding protein, partial [Paraburkholderia sp.]|uniref:sensor histidine kinase n=1 Tax=Paraburkholderia sp. TaxID=1926495 RepID=UPI00286EDD4C